MDRIENVGKFVLVKQGIGQNWQIILFTASALACSARFALRRDSVAELQIHLCEPYADYRVLRRLSNGIFELDLGGPQISPRDISFGVMYKGSRILSPRARINT
jgi:hypothetical protein